MPELTPFAAIRFDHTRTGGDLSASIAPPYDVLDSADKDALLAGGQPNIVAVDLPHVPPKSAGPTELYAQAAALLSKWLDDGTMVREESPALYVYHQKFVHAGQSFTRRMFIARLRLTPFSDGLVLPHEQTFGGPKKDRLALMQATKCQTSPILGMYADPEDRVASGFAAHIAKPPDVTGRIDDLENLVWIITNPNVIETVASTMSDRKVYIADGHHRYGTALLYRDWLTQEQGPLPHDHPANYIMFVLASMDDPGCLILPYNRVLTRINTGELLDAWNGGVSPAASADNTDLTLHDGATGEETHLTFTNRAILKTLSPSECKAWHQLDYAYLHRYLIDELLKHRLQDGMKVRYAKSVNQAKRIAKEQSGVALLTKATPMAHLRAVSEQGGLMPQKSTYFHPKLATGLALNPLA